MPGGNWKKRPRTGWIEALQTQGESYLPRLRIFFTAPNLGGVRQPPHLPRPCLKVRGEQVPAPQLLSETPENNEIILRITSFILLINFPLTLSKIAGH